MLRGQYGTATPSSLAPVAHREDAQPNEGIKKQFHKLPPPIRSTAPPSRAINVHYRGSRGRGGYLGANMSQREQGQRSAWLQYAVRGNSAWRGRGSRGSYSNWSRGHANMSNDDVSSSESSSSEPIPGVGVREPSPREEKDGGPSHRRSYSTAFPAAAQTSATPPVMESSRDPWWMQRSRSPTPKLPATPLKRRKIDEQPPPTILRLPLPGRTRKTTPPVIVKQEPVVKQEPLSPSPPPRPITPERKLITESCQYYPFPENCKKADPNHRQNRRSFFLEKYKELARLGLKKTRAFSRDDGLVIEWTSPIPVWSDTLKPEVVNLATVIQRAYEINASLTHSSASARPKKRTASHVSDSAPGPSRSRIKDPTPPRPHATQTKTPPLNVPPIPRKRLPLPGRQYTEPKFPEPTPTPRTRFPLPGRHDVESKSVAVPVAFTLRRSATPSFVSSCTPKLLNMMQSPANLPSRELTPTRAIAKTVPISPSPEHMHSQGLAEHHEAQKPRSSEEISDQDGRSVTTAAPPLALDSKVGIPDGKITRMSRDDEQHANTEDDRVEAEDVATSLLSQNRDNLGSEDDAEIDISTDDDGASEMEALVAGFLQRYCQLFDSDRAKLAAAYDRNALFSCCVHHLEQPSFSMAGLFAPEVNFSFRSSHSGAEASPVNRGRTEIHDRLLSMGPYQFCPRGATGNLLYDAVDSPAGILLTVHGEIVNPHMSNPQMDHVLTLDQSFVLRRRGAGVGQEEDDEDGIDGSGHSEQSDWPLVAISHQMTARAAPLLSTERLEKGSPWVREILQS